MRQAPHEKNEVYIATSQIHSTTLRLFTRTEKIISRYQNWMNSALEEFHQGCAARNVSHCWKHVIFIFPMQRSLETMRFCRWSWPFPPPNLASIKFSTKIKALTRKDEHKTFTKDGFSTVLKRYTCRLHIRNCATLRVQRVHASSGKVQCPLSLSFYDKELWCMSCAVCTSRKRGLTWRGTEYDYITAWNPQYEPDLFNQFLSCLSTSRVLFVSCTLKWVTTRKRMSSASFLNTASSRDAFSYVSSSSCWHFAWNCFVALDASRSQVQFSSP